MLPILYCPSKARIALSEFIDQRSAALPKTTRTRQMKARTLADGTVRPARTEHYDVRGSILSDGAEKTAWALIRLALRAVAEVRQVPLLLAATAADAAPTPPPVATNSEAICRTSVRGKRVASRTVRNHLAEMKAAGIITRVQFRGRKHDYHVWINPRFLWETAEKTAETARKPRVEKAAFAPVERPTDTNFPPKGVHEPLQATEIETGKVDKCIAQRGQVPPAQPRATPSGYTGQPANPGSPAQAAKTGTGRANDVAPASEAQTPRPVPQGPKTQLATRQRNMVLEFWWAAQKELYTPQNHLFTPEQERLALNAIYFGVYGGFPADWPLHQQERYHEQALERLGLAAGYFARNPRKYPPMPYAEHVEGAGYFDAANQKGFSGTMAWYRTHLAHRGQRALADGLRRARRELRQHALGTAPKRAQAKTMLELYRYHEAKMRQLGPPALERFYQHFSRPAVA
jgi:Fe2+ or Zn2+ uptake regulation protein